MNYQAETKHEAMGQRQRNENHGKVIFANLFFGLSYIPNVSKHFAKSRTIKRSVDDLELFDDQRRKSARII